MTRPPAILVLLLLLLPLPPSSASFIVHEFSDEFATERFNHMVVDENKGRVYVGAVNRLYQLSPDLDLMIAVKTGPEDDDPECSPAKECPANVVKRPTDNVNKALVIDRSHGTLIVCGSLFQGRCQTHVLYVGVTYTGGTRAPYRNEVPAVASRSLDPQRMFSISELAVTTGTRMSINSLARERYYINYVYGFGSEGFSYFLTTQMERSNEVTPYISKLAAYVGPAGPNLASRLRIRPDADVLYAVFAASEKRDGESSNKPTRNSALCVYSLKDIRRKFTQNIIECYNGSADRGLEFISPGKKCVSTTAPNAALAGPYRRVIHQSGGVCPVDGQQGQLSGPVPSSLQIAAGASCDFI
ncbi:Plexin-B [Amphibalanus amphitrite]|uniref:Plexin-B n=1 Tax=Amphibalanus amphitrite TaxID=1232801 RepID=A0A6A4VZE9_AMPAM|nr:Plexin-B [Amphibalanus amphitrite]